MTPLELIVLSIGLSMDASAVSISNVLCHPKLKGGHRFGIATTFGIFQGMMPVLGYLSANFFSNYIQTLDHWVAFVLLLILGSKMMFEAIKAKEEHCDIADLTLSTILMQAIATSIDAFAVGISFSALQVDLLPAVSMITIITLLMCIIAQRFAQRFGSALGNKAQWVGGLILVAIGVKILLEHLL